MFGTYRTLLALMVVAIHLGGIPTVGCYAVFGFYILSGYLMTFIMQENYGYTRSGIFKYALNRFLRIYPIYWVSIMLTVAIIAYVGEKFSVAYHPSMYWPKGIVNIIKNSLIIFPFVDNPRLSPPAWALTVEIFFYICIGLGISKNKNRVLFWLMLSVIYHIVAISKGMDNYFTIFAASLPFATGAAVYHYKSYLLNRLTFMSDKLGGFLPIILFLAMLANWFLGIKLGARGHSTSVIDIIFFYINYLICSFTVVTLAERQTLPFISKTFDKWLGSLSYPIYLIHYQVGLLVIIGFSMLGIDYKRPEINFMLVSIPFIILLSWIISITVEQPIERLRTQVKKKPNL